MKISAGIKEQGIEVGNHYDKYSASNPIVRRIMHGFEQSLSDLIDQANPQTIHEIGCGEGYWVMQWQQQGIDARGSDFSSQAIELARDNAAAKNLPTDIYHQRNIYDVRAQQDSADLIVCCEVLEHLEYPDQGLQALQCITRNHIILSVPREPLWRFLNMTRAKYLTSLGNTPGHLQHWSKNSFTQLVSNYFDIIETKMPLPWTMLLAKAK